MNQNNSEFIIDDQSEEREEYLQEYQNIYEDTQDLSNIVMELNNGN